MLWKRLQFGIKWKTNWSIDYNLQPYVAAPMLRGVIVQKRSILFMVLIVGFSLFLPLHSQAADVNFYAQQEVEKGWEALKAGKPDEALSRFNQATVFDPNYALGYYGKGHAYLAQNRIGLAVTNFKKTIELVEPPMVEAYVNLGLGLTLLGRDQEGLEMYNQALAIEPMNKDAHLNLANFYCAQLNGKKAWEHLRLAQKVKAEIYPEQLEDMKSLCPE